jgi:DNA repair protein RadA/Sms
MAKLTTQFVCQACGAVHNKWNGRCEACGAWNTLVEEAASSAPGGLAAPKAGRKAGQAELVPLNAVEAAPPRRESGIGEFDRVLGGGIAASSALLVGGDPGIGKSTLLLQVAAALGKRGSAVVYVSGEEAAAQIQQRAQRLGLGGAPMALATETDLRAILAALKAAKPDIIIIDSIQTMWSDSIEAAPGSVSQVRACAQEIVRFAKKSGAAAILVGHVTKDGQIAGPRVVEHMVDGVFYFEGERGHHFRILRGVKNRFGPTDEIGVFEMGEQGLTPALEPSRMFLDTNAAPASGAGVFAAMEGVRPMLVEVQALVGPSALGSPRRSVVGWETNRLAMLLAVLETRCGFALAGRDVYLNIAGGYRIGEPAGDLAAAAALASSALDVTLPEGAIWFGEVALSGDIRPVARMDARMREAARLGFTHAFGPAASPEPPAGMRLTRITRLADLITRLRQDAEA